MKVGFTFSVLSNYRVPTMIKMVFIRRISANLTYNFFKLDFWVGVKIKPCDFWGVAGLVFIWGCLLLFGEEGN